MTVEDAFNTLERLTPIPSGFKALCPNPNHNDKKLGNFYVNLEKGVMKCFSCGWGSGIYDFLVSKGVSRADAYEYFINPKDKVINVVPEIIHSLIPPKEFIDRGLSEHILKKFGAGYSEIEDRIELPVYFNDELVGYVFRKKGKKLYSSKGFLMHDFIYNYEPTEERFYTEGFTDVFRAYQNGTENISATLGVSVTKSQLNLMKRHKVLNLAYDLDFAGIRAMYNVYYGLRRYSKINVVLISADLGDKNDAGNCSETAWKKSLANMVPFVTFDIELQRRNKDLYNKIKKDLRL